jgi:hypothetical protein
MRRQLAQLDDRLLRDIGLDPLETRREVAKPFWLAPTLKRCSGTDEGNSQAGLRKATHVPRWSCFKLAVEPPRSPVQFVQRR